MHSWSTELLSTAEELGNANGLCMEGNDSTKASTIQNDDARIGCVCVCENTEKDRAHSLRLSDRSQRGDRTNSKSCEDEMESNMSVN